MDELYSLGTVVTFEKSSYLIIGYDLSNEQMEPSYLVVPIPYGYAYRINQDSLG